MFNNLLSLILASLIGCEVVYGVDNPIVLEGFSEENLQILKRSIARMERLNAKLSTLIDGGRFGGSCSLHPREFDILHNLHSDVNPILKVEQITADTASGQEMPVAAEAIVGENTTVYRGMKISDKKVICKILREGIKAPAIFNYQKAPDLDHGQIVSDVSTHSGRGSSSSILISTSYDPNICTTFAGKDGYVFEIKVPKTKAIDVNNLSFFKNPVTTL